MSGGTHCMLNTYNVLGSAPHCIPEAVRCPGRLSWATGIYWTQITATLSATLIRGTTRWYLQYPHILSPQLWLQLPSEGLQDQAFPAFT